MKGESRVGGRHLETEKKAEIITNPSPRSTACTVMTSTRREFLLIKVEGDQLSRWLSTNIRRNRRFNGLMVYALITPIFCTNLINRKGCC